MVENFLTFSIFIRYSFQRIGWYQAVKGAHFALLKSKLMSECHLR